jgi:hypothetical protein
MVLMKKTRRFSLNFLFFLGLSLVAVTSPVFAGFVDFFSINGIYSRRLSGDIGSENGFGSSALLEFQAIPSLSLGLGMDYLNYVGPESPGRNLVGAINLVSRLQFRANDRWTPFLMVGGGFNARTDFTKWHSWPWHYHLMGGLGTWYFLSHTTALDVGANYNFYDATGNPLQSINARLGLSFFFGETIDNPVRTAQAVIDLPGTSPAIAVAQANGEQPKGVESEKQEMDTPTPEPTTMVSTESTPSAIPLVVSSAAQIGDVKMPPPEAETPKVVEPSPTPVVEVSEPTPQPEAPAARPQAEGQDLGVPISKQEMSAPAARPQAEGQDLGVPISKQEMSAPAAEPVKEVLTPASTPVVSDAQPEAKPVTVASLSQAREDTFVLQYGEILTLKGDSVWDTSARQEVYFDPELYPLIVDANREALKRRYVFEEPMTLRFPTNATEEMKQTARKNAWLREYQTLGGRRLIPWAYQRWLMNHGMPNNFQEKK